MKISLSEISFSRFGSYIALAELPDGWQGRGIKSGTYLKTVSGSAGTPLVAKLVFAEEFIAADLDCGSLSLKTTNYCYDFCMPDPETLLIRGNAGASFLMDFMTENGPYDYIYEFDADGRHIYAANCYKNNTSFVIWLQSGRAALDQKWREQSSDGSKIAISGADGFLLVMKETPAEWDRKCPVYDFEKCRESVAEELLEFGRGYPSLPEGYEDLAALGAYVNWSAYVGPRGFFKRNAMLMSKNQMTNVWSWDHCFNALALSYRNPGAAWEQFMLMFDYQDNTGRLPDSVNDSRIIRNYVKPPIHGWTLMKMLEGGMNLSGSMRREAYSALALQTSWWLDYRDFDGDGLCEYVHGNDSGWDNSTVFAMVPPICAPDLQAFLIIQMDVLSELANGLGLSGKSKEWKAGSEKMLKRFLEKSFQDGLPTAFQSAGHRVVENQSLLPYLCMILGKRLPGEISEKMIHTLKTGGFISSFGFATESLESPFYRFNGYWRGPVWAPSTVLLCDGLKRCGEYALAKEMAAKFINLCQKSGFAENFDARTGEGLCDRAYTWTSSGVFILAGEYLSK